MYIISMWKNGAPDFIKVNVLLYRIDTCFSFCLEFEQQIDFERFFQQLSCDRLSRKQRFKVRTCPNNKTLVLENMSDGHIRILGNRKKYVAIIILRIFFEILSYWKEKSFDITTNTIPI